MLNRISEAGEAPAFEGVGYQEFLRTLGQTLQPRTYLEIGTNTGNSLAQMTCDAICIDPAFVVEGSPLAARRRSFFFQMSSDEFFSRYQVASFFPEGLDLAFLDGMHRFEYLLRDFMNVERACHARSLILMHDCLPLNARMAERDMRLDPMERAETRAWWTGDVWRVLPILKQYRPDLHVWYLDCPPTGLVAVSRLNPESRTLDVAYHDILREFAGVELTTFGLGALRDLYPTLDSREVGRPGVMTGVLTVR